MILLAESLRGGYLGLQQSARGAFVGYGEKGCWISTKWQMRKFYCRMPSFIKGHVVSKAFWQVVNVSSYCTYFLGFPSFMVKKRVFGNGRSQHSVSPRHNASAMQASLFSHDSSAGGSGVSFSANGKQVPALVDTALHGKYFMKHLRCSTTGEMTLRTTLSKR